MPPSLVSLGTVSRAGNGDSERDSLKSPSAVSVVTSLLPVPLLLRFKANPRRDAADLPRPCPVALFFKGDGGGMGGGER